MSEAYPEGGPVITARKVDNTWRASQDEVEVKPGEWVNFDSGKRPGRLWFPVAGQVVGKETRDLSSGPISVQTQPDLDPDTVIPYIFFLSGIGVAGEMLIGNSPPYIKIKDPRTTRGIGGG